MKYYKIGADQGQLDSIFRYGFGLEQGYFGEIILTEAMKYYKIGTDQGHADSTFRYGYGLKKGYLDQINKKRSDGIL
jgi:TPR repeat protein